VQKLPKRVCVTERRSIKEKMQVRPALRPKVLRTIKQEPKIHADFNETPPLLGTIL